MTCIRPRRDTRSWRRWPKRRYRRRSEIDHFHCHIRPVADNACHTPVDEPAHVVGLIDDPRLDGYASPPGGANERPPKGLAAPKPKWHLKKLEAGASRPEGEVRAGHRLSDFDL